MAQDGGPSHREKLLTPPKRVDASKQTYQFAAAEICRGIEAVSELQAVETTPGWVAVTCQSPGMARWLAETILQENVVARAEGNHLLVPVGDNFTLEGEIKSVITAVAKTTHYWGEHLAAEVKSTLWLQDFFARLITRWRSLWRHPIRV